MHEVWQYSRVKEIKENASKSHQTPMETPLIEIGFECGFSSFHKISLTHKVYVYGWRKCLRTLNQNNEGDGKERIYWFSQNKGSLFSYTQRWVFWISLLWFLGFVSPLSEAFAMLHNCVLANVHWTMQSKICQFFHKTIPFKYKMWSLYV